MIKENIKNYKGKQGGYTLLFAVLVSTVVLSIGISILTISKKEFLLSSSARESTTAFYSADSGIECAIYNDTGTVFSTTTTGTAITCGGLANIVPSYVADSSNAFFGTFTFPIKIDSSACAVVEIYKYDVPNPDLPGGHIFRTMVTSRGYNLGWDEGDQTCDSASPRRVERALRLTY